MRRLFPEYIAGSPDLLGFYAKPPSALFDHPPAASPWDSSLIAAIRAYQSEIGADSTFIGDEAVIVTGQQPGLFTGPLYTIYKAATAIRIARIVSERFGTPCVPVYWVGSEDHDFPEAQSVRLLTKSHDSITLTYNPLANVDGLPMSRVPIEPALHDLADVLAAETAGSEFRAEIRTFLHESLDASGFFADWTARLLARLFRGSPLVFFAPHIPAARALSVPIMRAEIENPLETTRLVNETARGLDAIDFPPQLVKNDDECSFFLDVHERRRKVMFDGKRFLLPEEELTYSTGQLMQFLEETPERFSPNVALRCIVQQHLFPAAAYVAGPGEIAYWAQLKPVFERHGMSMPVVFPRARAAITTLKLNKIRKKFGLELADFDQSRDVIAEKVARNTATDPAYRLVRDRRATVESMLDQLRADLDPFDKSAAEMATDLRKRLQSQFDKLERLLLQKEESRDGARRHQLDRLITALAPGRGPQERVYTVFSFLFEYGWDLIPRITEAIEPSSFALTEFEL